MHGILESIKRDRKLSFNHWRYRLLHWTFETNPSDSNLPNFLYTKYCPLFHLTNLLVIFFPLIVFAKIVVFLISMMITIIRGVAEFLSESINQFILWRVRELEKTREEELKSLENADYAARYNAGKDVITNFVTEYVMVDPDDHNRSNFGRFKRFSAYYPAISRYGDDVIKSIFEQVVTSIQNKRRRKQQEKLDNVILKAIKSDQNTWHDFFVGNHEEFAALDCEQVKSQFEAILKKYQVALEERKLRQKKMRERLVFWVNFSRTLGRAATYVMCATLALLSLYITFAWIVPWLLTLLYYVGLGLYTLGGWLLSIDLATIGAIIFYAAVATGMFAGSFLITNALIKSPAACRVAHTTVVVPFRSTFGVIGLVFGGFFNYVEKTLLSVIEFFSMFYEENCPSIEIVDDTSAEIDEIAAGE